MSTLSEDCHLLRNYLDITCRKLRILRASLSDRSLDLYRRFLINSLEGIYHFLCVGCDLGRPIEIPEDYE